MNSNNYADKLNNLIKEADNQGMNTDLISDGAHTFEDLYIQRMYLSKVIFELFPDLSWKSYKHKNGTMFDGYFIVGIKTPEGQYTYHYELKYWNVFNVKVVDYAPEYDGHTDKDITRLLSLLS